MSRTDTTRPLEVIEKDPSSRKLYLGRLTQPVAIRTGMSGQKGRTKRARNRMTEIRRQRDRLACQEAKRLHDPEDFDLKPSVADYRVLNWRAA